MNTTPLRRLSSGFALAIGLSLHPAAHGAVEIRDDGVWVRLMNSTQPGEMTRIGGNLTDRDGLRLRLEGITLPGDLTRVTENLDLPETNGDGYRIRWWSSDIEALSETGRVTRPRSHLENAEIVLKAFLRMGDVEVEKVFRITVLKESSSPESRPQPALSRVELESEARQLIEQQWGNAYAHVTYPEQKLDTVVAVAPGESIHAAVEQVKTAGGGVVILLAGVHTFDRGIVVCDRLTLVGAGRDYTILRRSGTVRGHSISHEGGAVRDIILKDFTLDGNGLPGQGVNFSSGIDDLAAQGNRILLQNVTIKNVFSHGMATSRVSNLIFDRVNLIYNGSHSELIHNLYLLGINGLLISDCNFSKPVAGKGLKLTRVKDVLVQRSEIRDTLWNGVQCDDDARRVMFHKFNFYNCGRTALWFIGERFGEAPIRYTDDPRYAPKEVIVNRCEIVGNTRGAVFKDVVGARIVNSVFRNRENDFMMLRCADGVAFEGTSLSRPAESFLHPEDVPIL